MSEKVKGVPQINKLHFIQIIKADLNMNWTIIFGRCVVHGAQQRGNIPSTQWGSRANQSSTDCIFLKRLFYDGLHITEITAIIFTNHAKAAFNHMIPSVGVVALQWFGASVNAVEGLLETLQIMRYQICTALEISNEA